MKRCLLGLFAMIVLSLGGLSVNDAHAWCDTDTLYCGDVRDSVNSNGHTDVNQYNCTGNTLFNGKAHVHWLFHPGGVLNITLNWSDANPARGLRVFLLSECDRNECIASDPHNISVELPSGYYFLNIDGLTNNGIAYHLEIQCEESPCVIPWGAYCSFTQGGWGQDNCSGGNVACRRNAWFDIVYPGSLVVGGTFTITLDASSNVAAYLPRSGTSGVLTANRLNPTTNGTTGVFGGQVVALRINRDFAAAGAFGANHDIGHLVKNNAPLQGWTVNQILALAEAVLGGNTALLAPNGLANVSALNTVVDGLNNMFDNCRNNGSYLNYVVEPECFGRCCYGNPFAPSCAYVKEDSCDVLGGSWVPGHNCDNAPCVPEQHLGRCCYGDPYDPSCAVTTEEVCAQLGGVWAIDENCETAVCVPRLHSGRCCYGDPYDPSCTVNTLAACTELGGHWTMDENCDTTPCEPEIRRGRCCYILNGTGACITNTREECAALNGLWDSSTNCDASECDEWLPVEFGSFDAISADGAVILTWNTVSEIDVISYSIERAINGSWMLVGVIPSLGNSATGHDYTFTDETVVNGTTYSYRLIATNLGGEISVYPNTASATPSHNEMVTSYALEQNYPNPFNPSTTIKFDIAEPGFVKLFVYDLAGRVVQTLVNNNLSANSYSVNFNGVGLSSGVYFYRLETANFSATKKLMLMK